MNGQVQCPVCLKFLDKDVIERHVDDCLKPKNAEKKSPSDFFVNKNEVSKKRNVPPRLLEGVPPKKKNKVAEETTQKLVANSGKSIDKGSTQHNRMIVLGKIPLAEQMRPVTFQEYFSSHIGKGKDFLSDVLSSGIVPSMIFWGPPGCGKTSLSNVICNLCKSNKKMRFVTLSATSAGVNDVKEVVKIAKNEYKLTQRKTVLFIDEVHRFNKLQQDTFLPHVEDGTITLIGATTENPSFYLNNALISRCRVVMMSALDVGDVEKILEKAVFCLHGDIIGESSASNSDKNCTPQNVDNKIGDDPGDIQVNTVDVKDITQPKDITAARFLVERDALKSLADSTNGDARVALNSLDIILQGKLSKTCLGQPVPVVTTNEIKEEIRRNYVNYDKKGDEHYDIISALHKSIRGSDENAAMYWLARMLEGGEQPLYIARRLVRCAAEDIGVYTQGLADPNALQQAVSGYQACHFIGLPECNVILAQVVTYLARARKSIEVYEAYGEACSLIKSWKGAQPKVPLHLRNAPTKLMKEKGYGKDYKYTPKCLDDPDQDYLPKELLSTKFFK